MTSQALDKIYYKGAPHFPFSISGKGLPKPKDFGLTPFMMSTACSRGFYCEYTVREESLWLTHLVVNNYGDYPLINGVKALYEKSRILGDDEPEPEFLVGRSIFTDYPSSHEPAIARREIFYDGGIYQNLNILAPLTGGILLGIEHTYVPHIEYNLNLLIGSRTVLELLFNKGTLVKTVDHSVAVDKIREYAKRFPKLDFESPSYQELKSEINSRLRSTLSLDYKFIDFEWLSEIYSNS